MLRGNAALGLPPSVGRRHKLGASALLFAAAVAMGPGGGSGQDDYYYYNGPRPSSTPAPTTTTLPDGPRECKMSDFGTKYRWDNTGNTYCICACADTYTFVAVIRVTLRVFFGSANGVMG